MDLCVTLKCYQECYYGGGKIPMSIDFTKVYKENLKQIENEKNQAILDKNWTKLAKLEAKKVELEHKIEQK